MKRSLKTILPLVLLLTLLCASAAGEYARVVTPGGAVKMRKGPGKKNGVVCEIPNRSVVEVDEPGEEWCHVLYGNKAGYVMTEYLAMASAQTDSPLSVTVSADQPLLGQEVEIRAEMEGAVSYRYSLAQGKSEIKGEPVPYGTVYWRPRKSGVACLTVTAADASGAEFSREVFLSVGEETASSAAPEVYSQRDGWWKGQKYGSSNLSDSGCAIFTLSHALRALGYSGEEILPETLAKGYAFCLVDGGTLNETLIGRAAKNFGFKTQPELIKSKNTILNRSAQGAVFTFSVVKGHIALAAAPSEDGSKVLILDSAPSVTMERLKDASIYIREGSGFRAVKELDEIPGAKYYFELDSFGGLSYYLDLNYAAKRGLRLIQPK